MRTELMKCAAAQSGAFTRAQALNSYTTGEIRSRIAHDEWASVFRGVYRSADISVTPALRVKAAELSLGCGIAACRETAAQLYGFDILDDPATHVLAARPRTSRVGSLIVHREAVCRADIEPIGLTWATNPARTAIDLARSYTRIDALALLDRALRAGVPRDRLEAELPAHIGKRGYRQAVELLGYASPKPDSPMESRTRMRCIDAGLPVPEPQVAIELPDGRTRRLDVGWRRWKIGLDYESTEWHTGAAAMTRDNPRHNAITQTGWTLYYATKEMVFFRPETFTGPIADRIRELGSTA